MVGSKNAARATSRSGLLKIPPSTVALQSTRDLRTALAMMYHRIRKYYFSLRRYCMATSLDKQSFLYAVTREYVLRMV